MHYSSFHDEVRIVPYQEEWVQRFQAMKERITALLLKANIVCDVYHVGGTAVPGMCGKPIVDVLVTWIKPIWKKQYTRCQRKYSVWVNADDPDDGFSQAAIRSMTPFTSI